MRSLRNIWKAANSPRTNFCEALRISFVSGSYIPVLCAAGGHEIGIAPLLNAIVDLMPSPADRPAITVQGKAGEEKLTASDTGPVALYVWKTTADPFVGKMTYFKVHFRNQSAPMSI